MIRIINIIDTMSSGGVERRRLSMAKLLDKSKFELKIICTNAVGPFPEEIRKHGVEVIAIGDLNSFLDYKQHQKVLKIIEEFKPHIMHGAVFEGVTMAAINGFLKRVPIIILEETSDPQNRRWKGNLLLKILCFTADKVIGVSPASTDYLKNKLQLPHHKILLITNGVLVPQMVPQMIKQKLKQKYKISADEIVIGSVGRMSSDAHKRFSDLIRAFAILVKKQHKIKLLLVGDGRQIVNYKQLVVELQIQDNVIFAGYQNEISDYYAVFDVFCLVSAYEAFGLVLAEAMFHKLPVVATRVGGMQHIVDDNHTGFLVDKFDVKAISEKLQILCEDVNLRTLFGNNGFEKAMINYTEERYVNDVENLYLELVRKKKINLK
ncbi:glycosyltransferase [Flavobacterium lacustre]|uniref:glycosyltransferase n=1 Tax=Flavobacterium lacustre TaxID=3016339 RepID=UPI0022B61536|nr:glycosyltransferase [Flavobacterium lacustre]